MDKNLTLKGNPTATLDGNDTGPTQERLESHVSGLVWSQTGRSSPSRPGSADSCVDLSFEERHES
jgi:hypothetical protein